MLLRASVSSSVVEKSSDITDLLWSVASSITSFLDAPLRSNYLPTQATPSVKNQLDAPALTTTCTTGIKSAEMAPKSALLTAGTTPNPPPRPAHQFPITTKEKQDAHAAKKARPQIKARSPPPDSTAEPAKKAKVKYLPPPGEVFQPPPKPKAKKKQKPITTAEKISAHEISKRIMGTMNNKKRAEVRKAEKQLQEGEDKERQEKNGSGKSEKDGKKKTTYVPSTLALLSMASNPTSVKFEDVKGKSVLMRPTARALAERQALAVKAEPVSLPGFLMPGGAKKAKQAFRIMDLPKEIRNRIWKMAVVHHPFCVWPGQKKGREQPDAAMSGREVREEVLPVYYGSNVFGVDITPVQAPGKQESKKGKIQERDEGSIPEEANQNHEAPAKDEPVETISRPEIQQKGVKSATAAAATDSIAEIKRWALTLEQGGHLSSIQHWVFSSSPEVIIPPSRIPKIDEENSLVVFLHIWRETVEISETTPDATPETVTNWRADVEVHREACCVLPGHSEYKECFVRESPEWLNRMVALVLERAGKAGGVTAEMVVGLAKAVRAKVGALVDCKCSKENPEQVVELGGL